jgi:hypothetical protein
MTSKPRQVGFMQERRASWSAKDRGCTKTRACVGYIFALKNFVA